MNPFPNLFFVPAAVQKKRKFRANLVLLKAAHDKKWQPMFVKKEKPYKMTHLKVQYCITMNTDLLFI